MSNGRFAVDREVENIELVSYRGLGRFFGPAAELVGHSGELFRLAVALIWTPWGEVRTSH